MSELKNIRAAYRVSVKGLIMMTESYYSSARGAIHGIYPVAGWSTARA